MYQTQPAVVTFLMWRRTQLTMLPELSRQQDLAHRQKELFGFASRPGWFHPLGDSDMTGSGDSPVSYGQNLPSIFPHFRTMP